MITLRQTSVASGHLFQHNNFLFLQNRLGNCFISAYQYKFSGQLLYCFVSHLIIYPAFLIAQPRFPFLKSLQRVCRYVVILIHAGHIFGCCDIYLEIFIHVSLVVALVHVLFFVELHLTLDFVIYYLLLIFINYEVKKKECGTFYSFFDTQFRINDNHCFRSLS